MPILLIVFIFSFIGCATSKTTIETTAAAETTAFAKKADAQKEEERLTGHKLVRNFNS